MLEVLKREGYIRGFTREHVRQGVAELKIEGDGIVAETSRGVRLGTLEPKLARRITKFMRGGNRYQAGVTSCEGNIVKLIVRETYQDPRFAGSEF